MALIAVAADKGSPGVTTASIALGAVWPRPVLLAECDPAGGDLVYRLPAADGGRLDPRRGLLSLAVAARRGLQPHQVWEHSQKLHGGLDVLAGVSGAEQGAGLELLWAAVGRILAAIPQADVIADCGRVGVDGPIYDLLAHASAVVLLTRATLGEVVRLRDRISVLAAALQKRGRSAGRISVVVIADYKDITTTAAEVGHALQQSGAPARVIGGLAHEPKSAEQLRGEWSGKLDKSMFIRTARGIAAALVAGLPEPAGSDETPGQEAVHRPPQGPQPPQGQPRPPQGQPQPPYRPAPARPAQEAPAWPAQEAPAWPAQEAPGRPGQEPPLVPPAAPPQDRRPVQAGPWQQPAPPGQQPAPTGQPQPPVPGGPASRGRHASVPADPAISPAEPPRGR